MCSVALYLLLMIVVMQVRCLYILYLLIYSILKEASREEKEIPQGKGIYLAEEDIIECEDRRIEIYTAIIFLSQYMRIVIVKYH